VSDFVFGDLREQLLAEYGTALAARAVAQPLRAEAPVVNRCRTLSPTLLTFSD
jgi:hypothetical protein